LPGARTAPDDGLFARARRSQIHRILRLDAEFRPHPREVVCVLTAAALVFGGSREVFQRARPWALAGGFERSDPRLAQPPIPWDVELARWMDSFLAPLEKRRIYPTRAGVKLPSPRARRSNIETREAGSSARAGRQKKERFATPKDAAAWLRKNRTKIDVKVIRELIEEGRR